MISADDINLFLSLHKYRNFSKAADKLGISSASLSRRITNLEKDIGTPLVTRSTRRLEFTEAGNILFEQAQKAMMELDRSVEATRSAVGLMKGSIRISSLSIFSNIFLVPLITEFKKEYPDIKFEVINDDYVEPPPLGEFDIAFRGGSFPDSPHYSSEISTQKFIVCGTPEYLDKHGRPKIPEDLKQHDCIDLTYRLLGNVWLFYKDGETISVQVSGSIVTNRPRMLRLFTKQGVGLAYLPHYIFYEELKNGELEWVLQDYGTETYPFNIITPYGSNEQTRKVRLFKEFVIERMKTLYNFDFK